MNIFTKTKNDWGDKEMNKQLLAWWCIPIFVLCGFSLAWFLHPDTKEVDFTALKVYCMKMDGRISFTDGLPFCDAKHEEKVISVLSEKKECEEKGGEFQPQLKFSGYSSGDAIGWKTGKIVKLLCTKPSETIFSYEITN